MIHFLIGIFFLWGLSTSATALNGAGTNEEFGIVTVPVADMILFSCRRAYPKREPAEIYKSFSLAPGADLSGCPRYRQLLYLETVRIKSVGDGEVSLETPNLMRFNSVKGTFDRDGWTLSSNVISFKKLREQNIDYQLLIPSDKNRSITLINPWHDETTGSTYSAGTHFVYSKINSKGYQVYYLAQNPLEIKETTIPMTVAIPLKRQTAESSRKIFLETLRSWCSEIKQAEGAIPYVWGGASFTKRYPKRNKRFVDGQWTDNTIKEFPMPGCDCSGLIYLVANRIANMPYFFGNTTSLVKELKEVTDIKNLKDGDLIWFSGHVIVIDSIKNKTIIHAQGYPGGGAGYIHQAHLKDLFEGASSFADFFTLKKEGKSLKYMGRTKKNFKLLNITSVFK